MEVIATRDFRHCLRRLVRKFPLAYETVDELIDELAVGPRATDNRLYSLGGAQVYKGRLPNRSAARGKSGGFRVYYSIKQDTVHLLWIELRSKSQLFSDAEIRAIARDLYT